MPPAPTFIDFCSGAGGFSRGFQRAGWTPLLGVDTCEHSLTSYRRNICETTLCLDLIADESLQTVYQTLGGVAPTAIIAGPPCQGFSMAGRRDPNDSRNLVFVECARKAVRLNPKLIIFENVPYLEKEPFKQFYDRAANIMNRNGCATRRLKLQAGNFGIPQNRWRLFLIGFPKAMAKQVEAVIETLEAVRHDQQTVRDAWNGLPHECSTAFHNHVSMQHSPEVIEKISKIAIGGGPLSYRKLNPNKPALTLIAGHSAMPCHYLANRTITVREAARIQSFDDDFVFEGGLRSQMNQVANAVPPKLAESVAAALLPLFRETDRKGFRARNQKKGSGLAY